VLARSLADVDAQAKLLAEVEQMSLGDKVAFIAIREADVIAAKARMPVRTANSRIMPKHAERNTKDSTNPEAQHVTGMKAMRPSPMPPEQMKNVKIQLTVNINTNTGPNTNISQLL
jgi:hypothetical protein